MAVTPWTLIDTATVPGGEGTLRLMQRGQEFSIMAGSTTLMNSRMSGSEEALASLSWERTGERRRPHMLIGGQDGEARITVAELVPAVVAWARGPMAAFHGASLTDPRVTIREGDVGALLRAERSYDAILLDVDNGPEGLTRDANDQLYTLAGLRRTLKALRPGGVLAVWSSHPSAPFNRRLAQAGFAVEEVRVRARGSRGGDRHHIWLAKAATAGTPRG